jgi:hypothetical protein
MNQTITHWRKTIPFTDTGRTFGAVDHVLPSISDGDIGFLIRGWFFDLHTRVSRPTCRIGEHAPMLLTYSCYRADVVEAFPSIPASKFSGFIASFPQSIKSIQNTLIISYYGKDEETEIIFTLPIPECPWLSQSEKFSVIAVITDGNSIASLRAWSHRNKPDLILCTDHLTNQLHTLLEEYNVRAYPESILGLFLKTYLSAETQVFLFGEPEELTAKSIQNVLEIGRAEPKLRIQNYLC